MSSVATIINNGIVSALHAQFPDIAIYDDSIEQDMPNVCFLVVLIRSTPGKGIDGINSVRNTFNVIYYTDSNISTEQYDVAEDMRGCLSTITTDLGKVHGTNMDFNTSDGILTCVVDYSMRTREETEPEEYMEGIRMEAVSNGDSIKIYEKADSSVSEVSE